MAQQLILDRQFDANGDPLSGALAYVYDTGTTTPATVYTTTALSTPTANPIVADSEGTFAQAFYGLSTALKVVYKTSAGVTRYTMDPALLASISTSEAADVSADPFTGVASTNVQDQLEEIQGNITDNTANQNTLTQTGGSSNAYTLTPPVAITAYAAGQKFLVRLNHRNTGAATLNVSGLGAVAVKVYFGGTLSDPPPGSLLVGDVYDIVHDGTRFVIAGRSNIVAAGTFGTAAAFDFDISTAAFRGYRITIFALTHSAAATRTICFQVGTGTAASPTITTSGYTYNQIYRAVGGAVSGTDSTSAAFGILSGGEMGNGFPNVVDAEIYFGGSLQASVAKSSTRISSGEVTTAISASLAPVASPTVLRILLDGAGNITGGVYRIEGIPL